MALRKAIEQTDNNNFEGDVGGWATKCTSFANGLSGLLFVIGISLFITFSSYNIEGKAMTDQKGNDKVETGYTPPPPPPPSTDKEPLTEGAIPPPPPPSPKPENDKE